MGFRQSQFPGGSRVLDGREWRRPGPAVVSADEDDIGVGLGDAGGDGANAHLGNELDADPGLTVGVL